jgi:ATP-dependent DNA helicase RecG
MNNPEKIEELIKFGEGQNLEFKSSFNNELIETLVAFANTNGGRIIVGINQYNELSGVQVKSESVQNWVNEIKHKTSPQSFPMWKLWKLKIKPLLFFPFRNIQ